MIILKSTGNKNTKIESVGSVTIQTTEKSINAENFDSIVDRLPMKSGTMHNKVQDFTLQFVKQVYNYLTEDIDMEKYYNSHKTNISEYLYNNKLEGFRELCSQLKAMKSKRLKLTNIVFVENSYQEYDNEYLFEMKVQYENEEYLNYVVHVNMDEENVDILFEPIT